MKLMVPTSKTVKIYTHSFCFFVFVWGGILTNRILQNIKEGNSSVICFGRVGVDFCSCFSSLEVGVVWEGVDVFLHHLVAEFVLFLWGLGHSRVRQENPHLTQHPVSRAGPPSLWPQEKKLCFPSPSEVLLESQKTFLLQPLLPHLVCRVPQPLQDTFPEFQPIHVWTVAEDVSKEVPTPSVSAVKVMP